MEEFILMFRMDILTPELQPNSEQMQAYMTLWEEWIADLAARDQLLSGNHFSREGRLLRPGVPAGQKPHTSDDGSVAGYLLIQASDFEAAEKIAHSCPILQGENTSVEIRKIMSPYSK